MRNLATGNVTSYTLAQARYGKSSYFAVNRLNTVELAFLPFEYPVDRLLNHYRNFNLTRRGGRLASLSPPVYRDSDTGRISGDCYNRNTISPSLVAF